MPGSFRLDKDLNLTQSQADIVRLPCHTRAVLFDLDDTLYDRRAAFGRWATAFAAAQLPPRIRQAAVNLLVTLDGDGYTERCDLFSAFLKAYPGLYDVNIQIEAYYREFLEHMEIPPEIAFLTDALKCSGIPFGIVTNGAVRVQERKIKALRLNGLVTAVVISEAFGAAKPSPSIFLEAATHLEMPPGDVLFVGDNPLKDICGARQAGMKTVWFNKRILQWPKKVPFCADLTIHSYEELGERLTHE